MEQELSNITAETVALWDAVLRQLRNLTLPSRLYQIRILLVGMAIAWGLRRGAGRKFKEWLRTREGWPK